MICSLRIANFKSLDDFRLPVEKGASLAPLTAFVGLNGAGKSTLLQALDFIGHLVGGNVKDWLEAREWKASDLITAWHSKTRTITITLIWKDPEHGEIEWAARYNVSMGRCVSESVTHLESARKLLDLSEQQLRTADAGYEMTTKFERLEFFYQGSVLSLLTLTDVHPAVSSLKQGLLGLKSLELLSPHLMRKRAKTADDIGSGGEKLSAFLSTLTPAQLQDLERRLKEFYPQFKQLSVTSLRSGWKDLRVREKFSLTAEFGAAQVNDGFLRVVGILAQAYARHSIVLFDEIENGVNQQIVERLIAFLLELSEKRQVFVTTHSPLILNFLPEDKARDGVIFLYKDPRGATRARRFFGLPQVAWKMDGLGPGEVFVDTDLTALSEELAQGDGGGKKA
jgi:predicted ATPase